MPTAHPQERSLSEIMAEFKAINSASKELQVRRRALKKEAHVAFVKANLRYLNEEKNSK